jgi:hypothetical protein
MVRKYANPLFGPAWDSPGMSQAQAYAIRMAQLNAPKPSRQAPAKAAQYAKEIANARAARRAARGK